MAGELNGRMAVVTGASSGLGRRFAHLLADAGASVALMARRADRLEAEVEAIRARGGKACAIALDVSDPTAIGPALDKAEAELGALSILINNAGVSGAGRALEATHALFDDTFAVNVRAVYFAACEAARRMLANGAAEAGHGRIVNIASIAAFEQLPALTLYCASKAAAASLTKGLAREWARSGIAVNAICPGYIETDINSDWFASDGGKRQIAGFPRRRLMDEDSLDEALMMLVGRSARLITGSLITIDDGQSL